ncbi:MAG: hypothetical protein ACYSUB_23195 [Planctomycetota bacterium]|jgi:hypothetical protein
MKTARGLPYLPVTVFVLISMIIPVGCGGGGGKDDQPPGSSGFGAVIETASAMLDMAEDVDIRLAGGARLEVPAGSVHGDVEITLVQSSVPGGLDEYGPITDIYYATSAERSLALSLQQEAL